MINEIEKSQDPNCSGGRKFDGGKPRFGLVPMNALSAVARVLTAGAVKYEPGNWRRVPDANNRYFDAAMRHMVSWKLGEKFDPETGENHLAHALCCLMFILEKDLHTEEQWETLKEINE